MTTKVPLSSLVGQTPVRVRFGNGTAWLFVSITKGPSEWVHCRTPSGGMHAPSTQLVEVLPLEPIIDPDVAPQPGSEAASAVRSPSLSDDARAPWRMGNGPVMCGRDPNDPKDVHYPIFWSDCGCCAHVFREQDARIVALAPEALDLVERVAKLPDYESLDKSEVAQLVSEARRILSP
jgi:hypothetical protein